MHYTNCYASGTENLEQNLIKKRKYYEYKSGKNKDSKRYYKSSLNVLEGADIIMNMKGPFWLPGTQPIAKVSSLDNSLNEISISGLVSKVSDCSRLSISKTNNG